MTDIARWKALLEKLNAEKLSDQRAERLSREFDAVTRRIFNSRESILDKVFMLKYFVRSGARETACLGIASIEKDLNFIRLAELLGPSHIRT